MCLTCAQKNGFSLKTMLEQNGFKPEDMENIGEQMNALMENLSENGDMEEMEKLFPPDMLNMMMGASHAGEESDQDSNTEMVADVDLPDDSGASGADAAQDDRRVRYNKRRADKLKTLSKFSTNLTDRRAHGEIDTVVGRSREIDRLMQILNRRTKNNPVLLGEPGVGKTAIAEGFALLIAQGRVPVKLRDKEVYLLDMTGLVAGTQFRGQFE